MSKERAIREIASVSVKATLAPATRATSTDREERGKSGGGSDGGGGAGGWKRYHKDIEVCIN